MVYKPYATKMGSEVRIPPTTVPKKGINPKTKGQRPGMYDLEDRRGRDPGPKTTFLLRMVYIPLQPYIVIWQGSALR